ncbi:MAG: SemiSWEET transporter [Thermoplasmatales archaeon]|nr:MAG: SemiSWEET transporter [Thermoplasmatales archaeon]
MDSITLEFFGLVAGSVTSLGFVPQLIRSYKTKKLDDVSYFMPMILAFGMILWFIYGFLKESIAVMAANAFALGCCIILIIMKKRYS